MVLVFLTQNYMEKVRKGDERDNVRREFMYAQQAVGATRMLPIRFETAVPTATSEWKGPVAMVFNSHLYVDLARDPISDTQVAELVKRVRQKAPSVTKWPNVRMALPLKAVDDTGRVATPTTATTARRASPRSNRPASPQVKPRRSASPRAKPRRTASPSTRGRVVRVMNAVGHSSSGKHMGEELDDVLATLGADMAGVFVEKLARAERELAIA